MPLWTPVRHPGGRRLPLRTARRLALLRLPGRGSLTLLTLAALLGLTGLVARWVRWLLPLATTAGRRATPRGSALGRTSGRWRLPAVPALATTPAGAPVGLVAGVTRLTAWLIVTVVIHNYMASQIATLGYAAFGGLTLLTGEEQPGWSLRSCPPARTIGVHVLCSQDV